MNGDQSSARAPGRRGVFQYFRRDRLTGQITAGLVGVLCVSALVYGVGTASARYKLADVGAWLSASAKGIVVHANGLAGKVDGKAAVVPQMRGHNIKIVQDGTTVLLVDEDTGVVSRIDPSQLKITNSRAVGGPGLQVITGAGAAYTVDAVKGIVQRIDPLKLTPIGQAATLTAPLGQAGIDADGALWVPVPQEGQVVPFRGGGKAAPVTVGKPGDRLALTIAAGRPVIVDSTAATALIVRPEGAQRINLPAPVAKTRHGVKVPAVADGQIVPMLGAGGALYLLDTGVGRVESVALRIPDHAFEPPHVLGPRVYLPDRTSGRLLVFNTDRNAWEKPITATRPGGTIEIVVRDHLLWVNDPNGAIAFAFDPNGGVKRIQKYEDKIPGSVRRPLPVQANPGGGQGNRNGSGGGRGGSNTVPPRGTPPPKKDPSAPDPPTPAASGDNGSINVRFTPAVQPPGVYPVTGFVLLDRSGRPAAGAGPARFPANGAGGTFKVGGLTCDTTTHIYKVAAEYKGKDGRTAYSESGEVGATACTAPGPPRSLRATPVNHGADLTWGKSSGYDVTYDIAWDGGGSASGKSTSHQVRGLTNGRTYTLRVTARNGAGSSTAVSDTADLNPAEHARTYNGHHNNSTNTRLRSGPGTGYAQDGEFPKGFTGSVKVICQQRGEAVTDTDDSSRKSSIWDKIEYGGKVRWVSDLYVATPGSDSGTFSSTLWGCV